MRLTKLVAVVFTFLIAGNSVYSFETPKQRKSKEVMRQVRWMMRKSKKDKKTEEDAAAKWDARIVSFNGEVYVKPASGKTWVVAPKNFPLADGDSIKTAQDGWADIVMDGTNALELGPGSTLTVDSLGYSETALGLVSGSVAGRLVNLSVEKRSVQVTTPVSAVTVRGADFAVKHSPVSNETVAGAYDLGDISVAPMEGGSPSGGEITVTGGNEAVVRAGADSIQAVSMSRLLDYSDSAAKLKNVLSYYKTHWKRLDTETKNKTRAKVFKAVKKPKAGSGKPKLKLMDTSPPKRAKDKVEEKKKSSGSVFGKNSISF